MKHFLFFLAALAFLSPPCHAASDLTAEQEQAYLQCISPLSGCIDDLGQTATLLAAVLHGERSDKEVAPEVKRLLGRTEQIRKAWMDAAPPEDEKVAELVQMWLNWNMDKLATMTSYLINFSNELLNSPNTDSELTEVLEHCFFAADLHRLSEFSEEEKAKVERELKILQNLAAGMKECIAVLRAVTNREQADAAAPQAERLMKQLEACSKAAESIETTDERSVELLRTAAGALGIGRLDMELSEVLDELVVENDCFDSEPLKNAVEGQ